MKLWSCVLIVGLSASASAAPPPTLPVPAEQVLSANGVSARCMARTTTQTEHPNWSFVVPAPPGKEADFAAKGFGPASCGALAASLVSFKAEMCDLALGNDAVQRRTEQVLGIDARKLCAAVTLLLPNAADKQSN